MVSETGDQKVGKLSTSYFGPEGTYVSFTQVSIVGTGSMAIFNLP